MQPSAAIARYSLSFVYTRTINFNPSCSVTEGYSSVQCPTFHPVGWPSPLRPSERGLSNGANLIRHNAEGSDIDALMRVDDRVLAVRIDGHARQLKRDYLLALPIVPPCF